MSNTKLFDNDCLKPCKGLYVDVKKEPVELVQVPQYQIMMMEYENYTWFQKNVDSQRQSLKGDINTFCLTLDLSII